MDTLNEIVGQYRRSMKPASGRRRMKYILTVAFLLGIGIFACLSNVMINGASVSESSGSSGKGTVPDFILNPPEVRTEGDSSGHASASKEVVDMEEEDPKASSDSSKDIVVEGYDKSGKSVVDKEVILEEEELLSLHGEQEEEEFPYLGFISFFPIGGVGLPWTFETHEETDDPFCRTEEDTLCLRVNWCADEPSSTTEKSPPTDVVPEPGTVGMASLGLLLLLKRRRS